MNQDFFDPEIYSDFVVEAREHLETIEPKLLELEKNPEDLSLLDDIFRPMHSLKGASGFLGLKKMNSLAHKGENILDELRKGLMKVTPAIMDLILEATDALREMVENLESQGSEGDVDTAHIIEHIEQLLENKGEDPAPETTGTKGGETAANREDKYYLTMVSQEHLSDFMEEVQEILADVSSMLLSLENETGQDPDTIDNLFRSFHNIKGNSGIIGFKEINVLSHEAETILNRIRNNELEIDQSLVDALLELCDTMEAILNRVDREKAEVTPTDVSAMLEQLRRFAGPAKSGQAESGREILAEQKKTAKDSSESEESLPQAPAGEVDPELEGVDPEDIQIFQQAVGQQFENMEYALENIKGEEADKEIADGIYRSLVTVQNSTGYMGFEDLKTYAARTADLVDQARKSDMDFSLMADLLKQEISILKSMVGKKLGSNVGVPEKPEQVAADQEVGETSEPGQCRADFPEDTDSSAGLQEEEPADEKPVSEPDQARSKAPDPESASGRTSPQKQDKDKTKPTIASTLRVDHSKLDDLMNLIGELIINRNRFAMLSKSLEEGHDVLEIAQQLTETTNSMARISDDLQVTIMNVRMVPVQTVFNKFPRLVRDLSRKSDKKVQLITEGEETELDKSVVELIGDPLVHLIRNSVDHGLEPEEDRKKAGKDLVGTVWLRAAHRGNSVVIEVEDDGRGIDPEKMKAKALEKNIISQEEAQNMEDQEAIDLIFAPGFSTAEKVTDISGRGVGMDVVKNNIKNLKGNVVVSSELGKGSKFSITLPLTLAIIEALMVKVAGQTYAIPLDAVSETTKIEASKLSEINNRKAVTLRGEVLGLADLGVLLELTEKQEEREVLPVVIIIVGDRRLGLVVDTLLERQEVVIKSLGEYMGDQPGISGATIMGDGRVVLILDPHEVYKMATSK
ncbi:MAG: Hpt domain-containing protein [Desulfonatronovibrio sp.]